MAAIAPFKISIPDSSLTSLKSKLKDITFPNEVSMSDSWDYGVPLSDMKRLSKYWADGFDWRAQEAMLNEKLPQFTTKVNVDGFGELDIHFVHKKSTQKDSIPLLFCHGWPGSFLEIIKMLPLLTDNTEGQSFHVVAPSLPNFGFSERVSKPGFGLAKYAEALHKVMLNLGYNKYVTQGGDWGFSITRLLSTNYPQHALATHLNFIQTTPNMVSSLSSSDPSLTPSERAGIERSKWFRSQGYGYNMLQSTRPHTLTFSLASSPVGLLAWIYEKLHDWTDAYPWTDDEVLTWISIYAFSRAGPESSVRIYYEAHHAENMEEQSGKLYGKNEYGKLGLSYFPRDLNVLPSSYGRGLGNVVFERRHEDGGHFAAYERPEALVGDLREMFGGGAKDVVGEILGFSSTVYRATSQL